MPDFKSFVIPIRSKRILIACVAYMSLGCVIKVNY